jgi:hypothetical protein
MPTGPFTAIKSHTAISKTITYSAIEAYMRAPITGIPTIDTTHKAPISRSP